jgi:hypothetical protein
LKPLSFVSIPILPTFLHMRHNVCIAPFVWIPDNRWRKNIQRQFVSFTFKTISFILSVQHGSATHSFFLLLTQVRHFLSWLDNMTQSNLSRFTDSTSDINNQTFRNRNAPAPVNSAPNLNHALLHAPISFISLRKSVGSLYWLLAASKTVIP